MEFNQDGDLLATGDKGGRVVIFQVDIGSVFILLTDWGGGWGQSRHFPEIQGERFKYMEVD